MIRCNYHRLVHTMWHNYACAQFVHQHCNDQIKCTDLYKRSLNYGSLFKRTTRFEVLHGRGWFVGSSWYASFIEAVLYSNGTRKSITLMLKQGRTVSKVIACCDLRVPARADPSEPFSAACSKPFSGTQRRLWHSSPVCKGSIDGSSGTHVRQIIWRQWGAERGRRSYTYLEERIEVLLNGSLELPLEKIHVVLGRSIF